MRLKVVDTALCVGCQSCMFACSRRSGQGGLSKSCIYVRSAAGMENGFVVIVCRACPNPPCMRVCPVEAIDSVEERGVKVRLSACIGCGKCAEACIIGAVQWDDETNKPMICNQCGICSDYCPHGVLEVLGRKVKNDACS